jgi:hypothetical protein
MMEIVQKVTFGIANSNMHPGKFLVGIFGLDRFSCMRLNHPIKFAVAGIIVRFDLAIRIKALNF